MKYLLDNSIWAFGETAPNLKLISPNDKVIIYLAGKERRIFSANFTVLTKPYILETSETAPEWLRFFPKGIQIGDIKEWNNVLPIKTIISDIDFIVDKKNYGLYFRQSTKVISNKDFNTIMVAVP